MAQRAVRTPRPASKSKGPGTVGALFRNVIRGKQLSPYVTKAPNLAALIKSPLQFIISDSKTRRISMFLLLSIIFMVVEFVYGFHSNSLGLVSDACHMLFDCAALAIGLYASYISKLQANSRFNYGYGRFEVISGYMNAVFLVLVASLIVLESLERILDPPEISTDSLLVVSIGGFLVNVIGLIFFHEAHHHHPTGSSCGHSHAKKGKSLHEKAFRAKGGDYQVLNMEDHDHHAEQNHQCISVGIHYDTSYHGHEHGHDHDHYGHEHKHKHDDGHHHDHGHGHEHKHKHKHDDGHHHDHGHGHEHNHVHVHEDHHSDDDVAHDHTDHNMQGMFLHILADTLGSIGVVVSSLLIQYKGWYFADPICSIFISALIIASVIPLIKGSAEMLLQRMPRATESRIQRSMKQVEGIDGVWSCKALHIWNFTNAEVIGSLHVLATRGADRERLRISIAGILKKAGVTDLTLQVETV
uniref:Cation efflux protein transmembrane domain-containing protein n=1 Tax=Physcomitrium patens TaxID=3218 RepID=A0A7I4FRS0_PHYPA